MVSLQSCGRYPAVADSPPSDDPRVLAHGGGRQMRREGRGESCISFLRKDFPIVGIWSPGEAQREHKVSRGMSWDLLTFLKGPLSKCLSLSNRSSIYLIFKKCFSFKINMLILLRLFRVLFILPKFLQQGK